MVSFLVTLHLGKETVKDSLRNTIFYVRDTEDWNKIFGIVHFNNDSIMN